MSKTFHEGDHSSAGSLQVARASTNSNFLQTHDDGEESSIRLALELMEADAFLANRDDRQRQQQQEMADLAIAIAESRATARYEALRRRPNIHIQELDIDSDPHHVPPQLQAPTNSSSSSQGQLTRIVIPPAIPQHSSPPSSASTSRQRYDTDELMARRLARSWKVESVQADILITQQQLKMKPTPPERWLPPIVEPSASLKPALKRVAPQPLTIPQSRESGSTNSPRSMQRLVPLTPSRFTPPQSPFRTYSRETRDVVDRHSFSIWHPPSESPSAIPRPAGVAHPQSVESSSRSSNASSDDLSPDLLRSETDSTGSAGTGSTSPASEENVADTSGEFISSIAHSLLALEQALQKEESFIGTGGRMARVKFYGLLLAGIDPHTKPFEAALLRTLNLLRLSFGQFKTNNPVIPPCDPEALELFSISPLLEIITTFLLNKDVSVWVSNSQLYTSTLTLLSLMLDCGFGSLLSRALPSDDLPAGSTEKPKPSPPSISRLIKSLEAHRQSLKTFSSRITFTPTITKVDDLCQKISYLSFQQVLLP